MKNPPIVFIPGLLCDQILFAPVIQRLESHSECIVVNTTQASSISELVATLACELPDKFNMVGFSLGGWISLELWQAIPTQINSLTLISCTAGGLPETTIESMHSAIKMIEAGQFADYIEDSIPQYFTKAHCQEQALINDYKTMVHDLGEAVAIKQLTWLTSMTKPYDFLEKITCPSMVVRGDEDLRIKPEVQEALAGALPNAQYHIITNAAHFIPLEQSSQLAETLRQFYQPLLASSYDSTI